MSNPRILGVAGGGLKDPSWIKDKHKGAAAVGKAGEEQTAAVLNTLAEPIDGPTVMHDLMVPSNRYKANLDHVVVSGRTVHVLDAKVWKPGFYWTLGSRTRRGHARFEPAEKQTMVVAVQCLESWFAVRGLDVSVRTPVLVVWPSSNRSALRLWALRVPGARCIKSDRLTSSLRSIKKRPADPAVVAALCELLVSKPRAVSPAPDPQMPDWAPGATAPVMPDWAPGATAPSRPAAASDPFYEDLEP